MTPSFTIEPARTQDLAPAFRLIFRHVPDIERELRVANALDLVEQKLLDPAGVRVARAGPALRGAVICMPVAGAGGILWPPQAAHDAHDWKEIEDRLVEAALHWLRERGSRLAQSLLSAHEANLAAALLRNGFAHVTDLWYMRHTLGPQATSPEVLTYQTYDICDRSLFHETLVRTYEDTQDCPEVNGVRTIEEVITGHRSQGIHDPQLWWLAWSGKKPVGVVLLTEMPEWNGWDLIYLGVTKEARGRGAGREMTARAIAAARRAGQKQLTLSVDVRNEPAWGLYRAAGFEAFDQRAVYLLIWPRQAVQ